MEIRCEGGMLDGKVLDKADPEPTIHQNGLWLLRVHQPYPVRAGEKVTKRLIAYTEDYALTMTEDGPVYRCNHPIVGLSVGDTLLTPTEGGGYDVYADRAGRLHAERPA